MADISHYNPDSVPFRPLHYTLPGQSTEYRVQSISKDHKSKHTGSASSEVAQHFIQQ